MMSDVGHSPLVECVQLRRRALVEVLLQYGADPNSADPILGPVLYEAVRGGDAEIVRMLLEAGADINAQTELGQTAFDALPPAGPDRDALVAVLTGRHGVR